MFAGLEFNDIDNRVILDLGAGTGRISIACAFLNASKVLSVDIDPDALEILERNIKALDLDTIIVPICSDVKDLKIEHLKLPKTSKITTIMNPPFGVQKRAADRIFLEKAFNYSDHVYSIHLTGEKTKTFLDTFARKNGWQIDYIWPFNMVLENTYNFHSQKTKKIDVSVYRFVKN